VFSFGGGVAPTTSLVAYGGDGEKMWRWFWEYGVVFGWWCLAELVTWCSGWCLG
jgi:hypothetical protein